MNKLILLLAMGLSLPATATELKGSPEQLREFLHPNEKTVTISKTAQEVVFKDVAIVSIVATTEHEKLADALEENAQLRATISSTLVASGIAAKHINNSKFSTSPDYGWFGDKPDSYKVSNVISIRISDEQGLVSIAKIVDKYKEVTLNDTQYQHSKKQQTIDKVKNDALNQVLKARDFYAKKLGVKLTPVSFSGDNANPAQDVEMIEVTGSRMMSSGNDYLSKRKAAPNTSFEKVIYKSRVSVSFKVN